MRSPRVRALNLILFPPAQPDTMSSRFRLTADYSWRLEYYLGRAERLYTISASREQFFVLWLRCCYVNCIARAMEETKRVLIAAGHEVVDWEPTGHKELVEVTVRNLIIFV